MSNKLIKKAYVSQMSFDITNEEKQQAEKALRFFKAADRLLLAASDYLNIMNTPFKDNPDIDPKSVMDARAAIRRFRDKAIANFDEFKKVAFQCVNVMQVFSSDTQTLKLVKSFITSIDELELVVNIFANLFSDLKDKDFAKNIVSKIEEIQKKCDEIDEIIDERIKEHIQSNILATSWVDSVSDQLQTKIEKRTPLLIDLYNQRQQQINQTLNTTIDEKAVSYDERSTLGN